MRTFTLPETNIAPENRPSQKEISIPTIHFWGQTFGFREGPFNPIGSMGLVYLPDIYHTKNIKINQMSANIPFVPWIRHGNGKQIVFLLTPKFRKKVTFPKQAYCIVVYQLDVIIQYYCDISYWFCYSSLSYYMILIHFILYIYIHVCVVFPPKCIYNKPHIVFLTWSQLNFTMIRALVWGHYCDLLFVYPKCASFNVLVPGWAWQWRGCGWCVLIGTCPFLHLQRWRVAIKHPGYIRLLSDCS